MPFPIVISLLLFGAQMDSSQLPGLKFEPAVMPGQREVVLGAQLQRDVVMDVRSERDRPAEFTSTQVFGSTMVVSSLGYARWSVTDGTLLTKPCRILKMTGITRSEAVSSTLRKQYAAGNTTTYWISAEGKVLEQSVHIVSPYENEIADCVFGADHVDVTMEDSHGRRTYTIRPNIDLALVDMQFKPMIQDSTVVLPSKEYCIFDPFNRVFTKYKASVQGPFHGTWSGAKFEGNTVMIEGPSDHVTAFITKEGFLIKMVSSHNRALVLNSLPIQTGPLRKVSSGTGN